MDAHAIIADRIRAEVHDAPHRARHQCPALRQRPAAPGPSGGLHPGRHLGARAAHARRHRALRLCRRHPRHADHARRGKGRRHARGLHRRHPGRARARLRRVRRGLRPLRLHQLAAQSRADRNALRRARGQRPHRAPQRAAVLRPSQGHVPARPLRQGHLPELRLARPIRRQLRSLRRHLRADRAEGPEIGGVRCHPGAARLRTLFLRGQPLRGLPARLAGR